MSSSDVRPPAEPQRLTLALSGTQLELIRNGSTTRPQLRVRPPGRPFAPAWPIERALILGWRRGRLQPPGPGGEQAWTLAWGALPDAGEVVVRFHLRRRGVRRSQTLLAEPTTLAGVLWVAEIGSLADEVTVSGGGVVESRVLSG